MGKEQKIEGDSCKFVTQAPKHEQWRI